MKQNMIGWVEIPVIDMNRAKAFYENVFQIEIQVHEIGESTMGWFPWKNDAPGSGGMLIHNSDFYAPDTKKGTLVYFNCDDVQNELKRAETSGAQVLKPKTQISESMGYMGLILDSEGNRIGLYSRS